MPDGAAASGGEQARLSAFLGERKRLLRLAYRYLGSVSEAEDAVQDAWLRFAAADAPEQAGRYLSRIVTNLCLDRLKAAKARREHYVGPWLPEPLVEAAGAVETGDAALDISFGVMRALERLSPLERAALFLHDLYELSFDEVAETLKRSPAACRQMATRARRSLKQGSARFQPSEADVARFVAGFAETARTGDIAPLKKLLAADVDFVSDGGGKATAALNVVSGADKVVRFLLGLARKRAARTEVSIQPAKINGGPGLIVHVDGKLDHTMAFSVDASGVISAIYVVRNPDKLRAVLPEGNG